MSVEAGTSKPKARQSGVAGRALIGASIACLVGAGIMLWQRQGEAVFGEMVLAALAWCF